MLWHASVQASETACLRRLVHPPSAQVALSIFFCFSCAASVEGPSVVVGSYGDGPCGPTGLILVVC